MIRHMLKRSPILPFSMMRYLSSQTVNSSQATPKQVNQIPNYTQEEFNENEKALSRLYEHIPRIGSRYLHGLRLKKFVNKMEQLYLKERKFQRDNEKRAKQFLIVSLGSTIPIHDAFRYYFKCSTDEFAARNIVMCLKTIGDVLRIRGPSPVHYLDYSQDQLVESWQFVHLLEDIKFALKLSTVIIPYDISRVILNTNTRL